MKVTPEQQARDLKFEQWRKCIGMYKEIEEAGRLCASGDKSACELESLLWDEKNRSKLCRTFDPYKWTSEPD